MKTDKRKNEQQLLRVEEVAELLRTTPRTIYRWLKDRKIAGKKVGRSWRIPKHAVSDLVGQMVVPQTASTHQKPISFDRGEHLLALASERESVAGMMARLVEMGLQHQHKVFVGCWSFSPNEFRHIMRTLGLPADTLEAEGLLTVVDLSAVFQKSGMKGVLQTWELLAESIRSDDLPLLAIGTPSLDCWGDTPSDLVEFEDALDQIWHATNTVSICVYPLSDFVPAQLRRLGTIISKHSGILLWSETELMLLRSSEFSKILSCAGISS